MDYYNGILSKFTPNRGWSFIQTVVPQCGACDEVQSNLNFFMSNNNASSISLNYNFGGGKTLNQWVNHTPEWHQVAVTYDGSIVSMYFDGIKVASSSNFC